ncbi:hypothetical protein KEM55_004462 [Ascosphaera atra]|nr:hypothetical protein KEM55_004462 [Ascosphaera atra]
MSDRSKPTPQIPAWQMADAPSHSSADTTAEKQDQGQEPAQEGTAGNEQTEEQLEAKKKTVSFEAKEADKPSEEADSQEQANADNKEANDAHDSKEDLLDSARRWLADEDVKDAPMTDKASFLEQKGLSSGEIQSLLDPEATDAAPPAAPETAAPSTLTPPLVPATPAPSPHAEGTHTTPTQPSDAQAPAQATAPAPAPAPAPPIITYPEFLMQPEPNPPLFSLSGLLCTLYGITGAGATLYGASKYLLNPMVNSLAEARLDFASNAKKNLGEFNSKLEDLVSEIPAGAMPLKRIVSRAGSTAGSDAGDEYDDPTELFHRDMGVQTDAELEKKKDEKPGLFRVPSGYSTRSQRSQNQEKSTDSKPFPQSSPSAANDHVDKLSRVAKALRSLNEAERESEESNAAAQSRVQDLSMYLDGLTYSVPSYMNTFGYAMLNDGAGEGGGKEDAVTAFRKEIRSVKGTLLSAKNFPTAKRR